MPPSFSIRRAGKQKGGTPVLRVPPLALQKELTSILVNPVAAIPVDPATPVPAPSVVAVITAIVSPIPVHVASVISIVVPIDPVVVVAAISVAIVVPVAISVAISISVMVAEYHILWDHLCRCQSRTAGNQCRSNQHHS